VVQDRDQDFVVDIVGTGTDGFNTFNVNTTAPVVAAGAVVKVFQLQGERRWGITQDVASMLSAQPVNSVCKGEQEPGKRSG
jgi:anthranilate phosphoribosyltransferase